MSHHIITSGGAAHDVKLSVAPMSVSFASSSTAKNVAAYTDEDTTDTVDSFAPTPSWSRGVVKTPPRSGHSEVKRRLSVPWSRTLCAKVSLSTLSTQDRAAISAFSLLLPRKVL